MRSAVLRVKGAIAAHDSRVEKVRLRSRGAQRFHFGTADELARFAEEITIPFVETKAGLVARYTGRGVGETGEELTMVTLWEDLDA